MREPFEEIPAVNDFTRFRLGWILLAIGLLFALAVPPALTETQFSHTTVGTIGTLRDPTETNGTPEQIEKRVQQAEVVATTGGNAAVIRELEASKGDGHELVGRKVDLTLPVQSRANDQAFWIGSGENEMLAVVHRDNRTAEQRYFGVPSGNAIDDVKAGQQVTVTGTIQAVPYREATYSWGLSTEDVDRLEARPIYIEADSVRVAGR